MDQQILILLTILATNIAKSQSENVVNVWTRLGWKKLSILGKPPNPEMLCKKAFQRELQLTFLDSSVQSHDCNQDFLVYFDENLSQTENLTEIASARRPYSVMLVTESSVSEREFLAKYSQVPLSLGFFRYNSKNDQLHRVQTFKNSPNVVLNLWRVNSAISSYIEDYSLSNTVLHSSTLSYMPYIK
jgi:hypothetical protein